MRPDAETAYRFLTEKPAQYGQMLGYTGLRDDLHGEWIRKMILGHGDMTLQAHRGSYKTTCDCIGLAINIILRGDLNSIFLRKTDTDIKEVFTTVDRILRQPVTQELYKALTGQQLTIIHSTNNEITTSSYTAPRGAAQLLGIGIGCSLTGKHADRVWTDDIVNQKDRRSAAERDLTKSIYQELQNVCNPGGRIINTGTPWHKEDAFTLMPKPETYDVYTTGIKTRDEIEKLRKSMTPVTFRGQLRIKAHSRGERPFYNTAHVHRQKRPAAGRNSRAHRRGLWRRGLYSLHLRKTGGGRFVFIRANVARPRGYRNRRHTRGNESPDVRAGILRG